MKKNLLLFFLLLSFGLNAQQFTGSLLWKISGKGLTKPSYIMGTHHFAHVSFLDSLPHITDRLNEVEQVVGEMEINDMIAVQSEITQLMFLPEEVNYKDFLSEKEFNELDTLLINQFGAGLNQGFGRIKPAILSTVYAAAIFTKTESFDSENHTPIDLYFQQVALDAGKNVLGLESIEDQIYVLLEATSYKEQAEDLLCTLRFGDSNIETMKRLNQYYYNADFINMEKLINDPLSLCQTSQEAMDILNKDRNNKWLEKLPEIMSNHSSFIAVGCMHLIGEDGLLYQLNKMGYTVKAVK